MLIIKSWITKKIQHLIKRKKATSGKGDQESLRVVQKELKMRQSEKGGCKRINLKMTCGELEWHVTDEWLYRW